MTRPMSGLRLLQAGRLCFQGLSAQAVSDGLPALAAAVHGLLDGLGTPRLQRSFTVTAGVRSQGYQVIVIMPAFVRKLKVGTAAAQTAAGGRRAYCTSVAGAHSQSCELSTIVISAGRAGVIS